MSARITDHVGAVFHTTTLACVDLPEGRWFEMGYRRTRQGLVGIYRQIGLVRFVMIHAEREYERTVWGSLTDRGVSRVACRFARDDVAGAVGTKRRGAPR